MAVANVGTFDFVIAGGGTAGLTLAARLTEVPTISVAVLEAGVDRSSDLNVLAPGLLTALYGNEDYDWIYETTPQVHANNRVIGHPRGKQLGGSSAINYLAYTHASQQNIDDWGALGNEGWNWSAIAPYYKKSENWTAPSARVASDLNTSYIVPSLHGQDGEIRNTFPNTAYTALDEAWPRTYDALELGVTSDPKDGLALGGYTILTNLDTTSNTRSYAATAYLNPIKDRSNLKVFTSAIVEKINLSAATKKNPARATGVTYSLNGTRKTITAKSEVLLSAGSFGSPQILELSGIGSAAVLEAAGVTPVVVNEYVGENLQDHAYMPLGFEVVSGIPTLDDLVDENVFNAAYEQYLVNATGQLASVALGGALLSVDQILPEDESLGQFMAVVEGTMGNISALPVGQQEQYQLITRILNSPSEAAVQHMNSAAGMNPELANNTTKLFSSPTPGNFFTILGVLEHPFSRGSVHITSSNASVHPAIDPRYLSHEADVEVLTRIALWIQDVLAVTPPLTNLLKGNGTVLQPVYRHLTPANVRDEVRRLVQSEYHPSGTCAMLPKAKGGVVDSSLKVYGVDGLRVVDASIFPMLPRANLQTLVYAVAERAADLVKRDFCGGSQRSGCKGLDAVS